MNKVYCYCYWFLHEHLIAQTNPLTHGTNSTIILWNRKSNESEKKRVHKEVCYAYPCPLDHIGMFSPWPVPSAACATPSNSQCHAFYTLFLHSHPAHHFLLHVILSSVSIYIYICILQCSFPYTFCYFQKKIYIFLALQHMSLKLAKQKFFGIS